MTAAAEEAIESPQTGRNTYRYLRGSMVVVVVLLAAAILIDSVPTDCWQGSISAYYYTAARNVFVAALCCLGILMIVYKGSTDSEDVLLNLAGTLAFFVAFVPSSIPETPGCQQMVPTAAEKWDAIENNIGALIVALVIALGTVVFVYIVDKDSRAQTSLWGNRLRVLSAIVLAVFVAAFFLAPELFEAAAHWTAAILIFVIIGAVVFINAYLVGNQDKQDRVKRERFHLGYRVIAWAMVGSLLGALIVAAVGRIAHLQGGSWDIPVFALETALLLEFAVFWALQTVELWNYADRNTLIPQDKQATMPPL
ncbi:MAG TPA: hypothetical protein VHT50_27005 [Mycobacterium sp.]|nr:hypothetical protein [Mycobacterium sp.]